MTRITETFRYTDLTNGIFTPTKDVIVATSLTLSISSLTYRLIDLDVARTAKAGTGCYKRIYFGSFNGELTISYETYDSIRTDVNSPDVTGDASTLDYGKVLNKTTVVEDIDRDTIDFNNIADVEPLIARYMFIQQFIGRRLTSRFVIARALDDYFTNYYTGVSVDASIGYIEPDIPWLVLNSPTGNSLDYTNGLSITLGDEIQQLDPYDAAADAKYDLLVATLNKLTPTALMDELIESINTLYNPTTDTSVILEDSYFKVNSDSIELLVNGTWYKLNWNTLFNNAVSSASEILSKIGTVAPTLDETSQNALQELIDTIITNGDTTQNIKVDLVNGSTITIDGLTINLIGTTDSAAITSAMTNLSGYLVPEAYQSSMTRATELIALKDLFTAKTLINKVATTVDSMLTYLES